MSIHIYNRTAVDAVVSTSVHRHFSRIADRYRLLRTTDSEPIALIGDKISPLTHIEAVDVGCGTGRYDLLLCKYLGDTLQLACVDANLHMLEMLHKYLERSGISNFTSVLSRAEHLPFRQNSFDCVCTFNAIHHFNLPTFLHESARILKHGGYLFIYTRLRDQNRRNIWGRHFPGFYQKETRLYTLDTFIQSIATVEGLVIESIEYLKYERISTVDELVERASEHHYSTFLLYSPEELDEAIAVFKQKIGTAFDDMQQIRSFDENVLFTIRKVACEELTAPNCHDIKANDSHNNIYRKGRRIPLK